MTAPFDASRYQRALERWRLLAERRLDHLTLLYESGRWRRYFSEEKFLGFIRETRAAVDAWQRLAPEQASPSELLALAGEAASSRTAAPPSPFTTAPVLQRSVA